MNTTDTISRTNAVSLADENAVKEVLIQSVLGLWDVVNNLNVADADEAVAVIKRHKEAQVIS